MTTARALVLEAPRRLEARMLDVPDVGDDDAVLRVANESEKLELIASDAKKFFTEPHYNGFPAVLVRLAAIRIPELRELLTDAWRTQAPKKLVREFEGT